MPRLYVDELVSVGAVDAGDNPQADILFWKRHTTTDDVSMISVESAGRAGQTKGAHMLDLSKIADDEVREAVATRIAELETQLAAGPAEETVAEEIVEKADPAVQELVKSLQAKIDGLTSEVSETSDRLASEVKKAREREFVTKAAPFTNLLGAPGEVAPVFDALEKGAPEAFTKLEGMLTAAAQRADLADLFKEKGSGESDSDPIAKRDAFVKEWVEKHPDRNPADARAEYWRLNPEARRELRSH